MRRGTAIAVLYDVLIDARYQVEKDAINMAIEALSEPSGDLISRQAAIRWVKTECNPYGKATLDFESGKKVIKHLKQMPSAEAETVDCTDFIRWLTETVMDDGMWELNAVAYGEVIARKLTKLGVLEVKDGYYIRHVENNTKESDLVYRPSAEAADVYKAHEKEHEEEHLKIVNSIKELQYAIAKTQTIVGKVIESAEAEWIPCSNGLPKAEYGESDCVLATCGWKSDATTRWIEKLYFDGGNWCYPTGERFTQKVIAWKPMPEPYREDGEE